MYRTLATARPLWSIGGESRPIIEHLHGPAKAGWESGRLTARDVTAASRRFIPAAFVRRAAPWTYWRRVERLRARLRRSSEGSTPRAQPGGEGAVTTLGGSAGRIAARFIRCGARHGFPLRRRRELPLRLLEKTPENCLRLPFLLEIFPDARVIFLIRDGRANVASLIEGWRRPDLFPGYRVPERLDVAGVPADRWAFALIPGWRELRHAPLEEICAQQWRACNEAVLDFTEGEGREVPLRTLRYEELVERPHATLARVAAFAEVELGNVPEALPPANVVSAPDPEKWRRLPDAMLDRIEGVIGPTMERLGYPGGTRDA